MYRKDTKTATTMQQICNQKNSDKTYSEADSVG